MTPSQILVSQDFIPPLLHSLANDRIPTFLLACEQLLDYLPSDQSLLDRSGNPEEFIERLDTIGNDQYLKYYLEILAWRLGCRFFVDAYRKTDWFDRVLAVLEPRPCCLKVALGLFTLLCKDFRPEVIAPCLRIVANPSRDVSDRMAVAIYLADSYQASAVDAVIAARELIAEAIDKMESTVWPKFVEFIEKLERPQELFALASSRIESNNPYFLDLYLRYFELSKLDPDSRFETGLKALARNERVIEFLARLVENNSDVFNRRDDLFYDIICTIKSTELPHELTAKVFRLLTRMVRQCPTNGALFDDFLGDVAHVSLHRWGVTTQSRHPSGLCGLRNLGATCYINAVFQQLFRISAFRLLLLEAEFEPQSGLAGMQTLLYQMLHSQRGDCGTEQFCNTWIGWGGRPINRHEQQDANEFLSLIVNQLPDSVNFLFRGELANTIRSCSDDGWEKRELELFITIGLTVKNFASFESSLEAFFSEERLAGANQYKRDDGRAFDATKRQTLVRVPPVIFFQLRRFEFDDSHHSEKITSRFTFPMAVDLRPESEPAGVHYELQGVILHSGTVNGGHYTSVLRVDDRWLLVNDTEVEELREARFEEECFGGERSDFEMRPMAYILVFVNRAATVNGTPVLGEFTLPELYEAEQAVEQDNYTFYLEQMALTPAFMEIFLEHAGLTPTPEFFFNIFCHTRHVDFADRFVQRLAELDDGTLVSWLGAHFDGQVAPVFARCPVPEMQRAVCRVLKTATTGVPLRRALPVVGGLVRLFGAGSVSTRLAPDFTEILGAFLSPEGLALARADNWVEPLSYGVCRLFSGEVRSGFSDTLNASAILTAIVALLPPQNRRCLRDFPRIYEKLSRSRYHAQPARDLLLRGIEEGVIDIASATDAVREAIAPDRILALELAQASRETFGDALKRLKAHPGIPLQRLVAALRESVADDWLVEGAPVFLRWYATTSDEAQLTALLGDLASRAPGAMLELVRRYVAGTRAVHRHVLLLLLRLAAQLGFTGIARQDLESQPSSDELRFLHVYLGWEPFDAFFAAAVPLAPACDVFRRLRALLPLVAALPADAVARAPHWDAVLRVVGGAQAPADIATAAALAESLAARQGDARVHQLLMWLALTVSPAEHKVAHYVLYLKVTAEFLRRVGEPGSREARRADAALLQQAAIACLRAPLGDMGAVLPPIVDRLRAIIGAQELAGVHRLQVAPRTIADVFARRMPPAALIRTLVEYVRLLVRGNDEYRADVVREVEAKLRGRECGVQQIWLRAVLIVGRGGNAVAADLLARHADFVQMNDGAMGNAVWETYKGFVLAEPEQGAVFVVEAFAQARLVMANEIRFFRETLASVPTDHQDALMDRLSSEAPDGGGDHMKRLAFAVVVFELQSSVPYFVLPPGKKEELGRALSWALTVLKEN
jgi:hypothetical protein